MYKVKEFIKKHEVEGALFVLKGFDLERIGVQQVNLSDIIVDSNAKMQRLLRLQNIPVISYAEYILLFNSFNEFFNHIYILENAIYYHLWPMGVTLSDDVLSSLLINFNQDADDDLEIEDLKPYIEIFSNFVEVDGQIWCNFNLRDELLSSPRIDVIRISENTNAIYADFKEGMSLYNICDQEDYIRLIINLSKDEKSYGVSIDNFIDSVSELKIHLDFLAKIYPSRIAYYHAPYETNKITCPQEIFSLIKFYWGYDTFRNIKTYDIEQLHEYKKETINISQEEIIANIVSQAENCLDDKYRDTLRDVFVTAPTGAGKSLMFQLPAMYLAQKYGLLTIVVSPLIALMEDQVNNLEKKGYYRAATINSDKSPIIKQQIYQKIMENEIDLLYLSPESLLSRSDIEQLIGTRKIGLFVVDEAHIVTTWGKQFRPDYWFLGDHISKLRRKQMRAEGGHPFIIATFTATAIYGGIEDMYRETLNSLHMIDPITYLGYIKRENISIDVSEVEKINAKEEYEVNKFDEIKKIADLALMRGQKVLVYFPTVALIERCRNYWKVKNFNQAAICYGSLSADVKNENIEAFRRGDKHIMLATKAFGMGIDIPDIAIVVHFAPTGNVCDYMQEIGRAARKLGIEGHAIYKHMSNDFKYINRLHGMSTIRNYQLTGVIAKILNLYIEMRYAISGRSKKKVNSMLLDANSFAYLFDEGNRLDENDVINKVKTAMLLIQKDYERQGFAPFYMRPIPIFAYGYFRVLNKDLEFFKLHFKDCIELENVADSIYKINLEKIWEYGYQDKYTFPQFKYLLYSHDKELSLNHNISLIPALKIEISFNENFKSNFENCIGIFQRAIKDSMLQNLYINKSDLIDRIAEAGAFSSYFAENFASVLLAAADTFNRDFNPNLNSKPFTKREKKDGEYGLNESYQFTSSMNDYFYWLRKNFQKICLETKAGNLYAIGKEIEASEVLICLGVLEAMKVLQFKALGGLNSQLYIYVNETRQMQLVKSHPEKYKNRLLELVNKRHEASVQMMTYLFQSGFTSDQIWDKLEDYFLGITPEGFNPSQILSPIEENNLSFVAGDSIQDVYQNWEDLNAIFEEPKFAEFDKLGLPLPESMASMIYIGEEKIDCALTWESKKVALIHSKPPEYMDEKLKTSGWQLFVLSGIDVLQLKLSLLGK